MEEFLEQASSHGKHTAPRATVPEGKGALQESSSAAVCDPWIPETAAAPVANSIRWECRNLKERLK